MEREVHMHHVIINVNCALGNINKRTKWSVYLDCATVGLTVASDKLPVLGHLWEESL